MYTARNSFVTLVIIIFIVSLSGCSGMQSMFQNSSDSGDPIVEGFKKVAIASVADAVDQVCGIDNPGYMSYDMRPIIGKTIVGRATTSLIRPLPKGSSPEESSLALTLEMIDNAEPGEVGVIVVADGLNIAGIGGLMANGAVVSNMSGIVIDGGVRDVDEITKLGLTVYARSYTPATGVGRYISINYDEPVLCAGVMVKPGDIIVGGTDGIVRVPQEHAAEVLKIAQEIDVKEANMVPVIKRLKSIQKAVQEFNRL